MRVPSIVLALALTAGGLVAGCGVDGAATSGASGWTRLPDSPLEARRGAAGVWTGAEFIVVGGTTAPACPPSADCADPMLPALSDGAAYDPETRRWRRIAEAPVTIPGGTAVWTGTEMLVLGRLVAYDPAKDSWRRLPAAPREAVQSLPTARVGDRFVFAPYSKGPNRAAVTDHVLDPSTGTWTSLPPDPFGESYDRSVAWDGDRLWLLSMAVEQHSEAHGSAHARLAVLEGGLEDGTWRVVEKETPAMTYEQFLWWTGSLRVTAAPSQKFDGAVYDAAAGAWTPIPGTEPDREADRRRPRFPAIGPGAHWIAGGGSVLTSTSGTRTRPIPPTDPALRDPVAVWADDTLLVWGGVDADDNTNSGVGFSWAVPE